MSGVCAWSRLKDQQNSTLQQSLVLSLSSHKAGYQAYALTREMDSRYTNVDALGRGCRLSIKDCRNRRVALKGGPRINLASDTIPSLSQQADFSERRRIG